MLSSAQSNNTHKPLVRKNEMTGSLYVVNSDYWKIVGIDGSNGSTTPKASADIALEQWHVEFD